ncbi:Hypothetical protein NTJ_07008 [Nesidiocoris tenuis]|uniref:Uncharacterized protein n=1 Tax=Nesidiocoris tenuis TaxID=355587 RepID=A0ABN7APQ7_9HEMI|nr:Hypothetical protein NTJ_07008 [Nesidiocoris tenuis]
MIKVAEQSVGKRDFPLGWESLRNRMAALFHWRQSEAPALKSPAKPQKSFGFDVGRVRPVNYRFVDRVHHLLVKGLPSSIGRPPFTNPPPGALHNEQIVASQGLPLFQL